MNPQAHDLAFHRFLPVWKRLEMRFGPREGMNEYLDYLLAQDLTPQDIEFAGKALWGDAEFFPSPAAFLRPLAMAGWRAVVAIAAKGKPANADLWRTMRATVPDRAWATIHELGGLDAVRETKDLPRLQERFLKAWERTDVITPERQLGAGRAPRGPAPAGPSARQVYVEPDWPVPTPEQRRDGMALVKAAIDASNARWAALKKP